MEKFIKKLINNKLFLFIVPNLIYVYTLLHLYNTNFSDYNNQGEVLMYEVIGLIFIFFLINLLIYFFLRKALKDFLKIFFLMCFISLFYFFKMSLFTFLIYVIFILILVIDFKKFIRCKLDKAVMFISFVIFFLFLGELVISIYNVAYTLLKSKGYDYEIEIDVQDDTNTPNIYWIHCDGMMGLYSMEKYFNYKDLSFINYLEKNNYVYNKNASLIAGHRTQSALVSMFNPYYFDHFFRDYLIDLEDSFKDGGKTDFMVNYYELEEKRLDNELFLALDKKDYTTVAIADFNQYTGFYTDYFYDFYTYDENGRQVTDKQQFRYMDNSSIDDSDRFKLFTYMRFNHFKSILNTTILYPLLENVNYLDYEIIPYEDEDFSQMTNINNSQYWLSKAIISGIDKSLEIDNQKFVFVDFKLNHLPITFNRYGDFLLNEDIYNLGFYSSNYIYSTKLLVEILDYIRTNDEEAVIFVQGDHGIHMLEDDDLKKFFNISQEGVQEVRNSVISAYYIPDKYKNGDEVYLNNPLNISRYIVNSYIGNNYDYIETK